MKNANYSRRVGRMIVIPNVKTILINVLIYLNVNKVSVLNRLHEFLEENSALIDDHYY
jgi:hypothetical protein